RGAIARDHRERGARGALHRRPGRAARGGAARDRGRRDVGPGPGRAGRPGRRAAAERPQHVARLRRGAKVFAEIYGPAPRLLVIGAVDTAEALCAAAKQLGWHTIVADARGKFATKERIPSADELLVAWPEDALKQVQPDYQTAVVVLTHDD